jgi:hypothetical protein
MLKLNRRLAIAWLLATVAAPGVAGAQNTSIANVEKKLKAGQVIIVTDSAGRTVIGKVTDLSPSTLAVLPRKSNPRDGSGRPRYEWGDEQTVDLSSVQKIARPGPIWDGAVKGAAVGLIPVFIVSRYGCDSCGNLYASWMAIGAGIGFGIDAAFGPKTIYRARPQAGSIAIVPVLTGDRRGMHASIRF